MNTYCILYVEQNGQDIKITYTNRMLQARTISLIICVYMCYAPRTIIQRLHKSPSIIRTNDYKIITLKSSHMCRVFSLHIYALVFSFFFSILFFLVFFLVFIHSEEFVSLAVPIAHLFHFTWVLFKWHCIVFEEHIPHITLAQSNV